MLSIEQTYLTEIFKWNLTEVQLPSLGKIIN